MNDTSKLLSPRDGYAAWSSFYDTDGNPLVALEGPAMQAWFSPVRGRPVLDLGCGTGRHTLALAELGAEPIVALDQSPEMLALAQYKLKEHRVLLVQHALPRPLPLRDAAFDLVVMGLVAEHVADLTALMREAARVLVPGGRCLLSALHAERSAAGQTARFIDPQTGQRRPIVTIHRTSDDHRAAGAAAGLEWVAEQELVVSDELAQRLPRAVRYVGQRLGWVGCWVKREIGPSTITRGMAELA